MSKVFDKPVRHEFTTPERIVNTLLLNASFIDNLGLMHGKMGICIFFYHLARKTENKIYEDYAGELPDEIFEVINQRKQISWYFENGLVDFGREIENFTNEIIDINLVINKTADKIKAGSTMH